MEKQDLPSPSSAVTAWLDEKFEYLQGEDGVVWSVRRNRTREAAEAAAGILRARVMFWNWAAWLFVRVAFAAGVVVLIVLICLKLFGGA